MFTNIMCMEYDHRWGHKNLPFHVFYPRTKGSFTTILHDACAYVDEDGRRIRKWQQAV